MNSKENKKITIAIDGWSSCGKSTLAKALAKELNYIYVDSGAMYRGVALYALNNHFISDTGVDENGLVEQLNQIDLQFRYNSDLGRSELWLNGDNVEEEIRTLRVSNVVSLIATLKPIRTHLVSLQQAMGRNGGIVMDGRDIASVVFPHAELKLFVTATPEIRAQRRYEELKSKGDDVSLNEVKQNLIQRDEMDTHRKESPLIQVEDAIVLDNSYLSQLQQLEKALFFVREVLGETKTDCN